MSSKKMSEPSNALIYELLTEVRDDMKRVVDTVSDLGARTASLETSAEKQSETSKRWFELTWPTHEKRVDDLEAFRAKAGVYMAISAAAASALVGAVLHFLRLAA